METEDKIRISQLCALAALSDNELAPSEAKSLETIMDGYNLSPPEKARALDVTRHTHPADVIAGLSDSVSKREVARKIASVIRADERIEVAELDLLEDVMLAFGVSENQVMEARVV